MKPVRTLILLAAEDRARFLVNEGVGKGVICRRSVDESALPQPAHAHSDRPGRQSGGPSGIALHGFDPHQTDAEQRRARFVAWLGGELGREWRKGGYDRIAIAAGPKVLGLLRAALPDELRPHVSVELAKDLIKVPLADLPDRFAEDMVL